MRPIKILAIGAAGLLAAMPAYGQQQDNGNKQDENIVVTGQREQLKEAARNAVNGITRRARPGKPLPRFAEPLCFGSAGLPPKYGQVVVNRMLDDAASLDLETAGEDCRPNVLVLFIDDAKKALEELRDDKPWVFGSLKGYEIRRVLAEKGPVHAWQATEVLGADGRPTQNEDRQAVPVLREQTPSRLHHPVRLGTVASVVLIDRAAIVGKTLSQLGDYATMRALAPTQPDSAAEGLSILSLFDESDDAPAELTAFDRAYLTGLYTAPANGRPAATRSIITDKVVAAWLARHPGNGEPN